MDFVIPWRWNRFGSDTWFLDAGSGVAMMAGADRVSAGNANWRYRASGSRARRVSLVEADNGREVVGVSLDWAGSGILEGTPGWRWERSGLCTARVADQRGRALLSLTGDADPATGASLTVDAELDRAEALKLAAFAWLVVRNEARGTVRVGERREIRRVWR